ncbi:hypothetical protein FY034_18860 (plasmid) [Trichlorobacter lovleyi]|uniref:hypothetical protein n=1 Tax=Trichlorobacter lovleyi TaxID=313985 RepID=UPI00223FAD25|nr:hypothetical protein [Trichlorobacter lovleyi]QOX81039.1 hypothetical protein FY034_18860 [Trichlorobacter lovleyi]
MNETNHIPITSAFRTVEDNNRVATQSSPSLHFPSLGMRRKRTYWNAAKPVQPTIISRSDSDTVQQDWYFSCSDSSIFLSGYRRYERDAGGNWFIAARWYPDAHALDNLIPIEEVPFPDDVVKEAIEKGYGQAMPEGFEVFRRGQHVLVMVSPERHIYQEVLQEGEDTATGGRHFKEAWFPRGKLPTFILGNKAD